jgi:hypothetical protein
LEFTGQIKGISNDLVSDELLITFSVNEKSYVLTSCEKLKDCQKLRIKADVYREKRSLNANAYFHVLVGKIAEALTISKARAKNILICKYGQPQLLQDGDIMVYKTNAPQEFMLEQESIHCIPIKYTDDATFYKIYRGSHTYDTKEMSLLIDGTVADAKELGIETLPPYELKRMKEMWGVDIE